MSHDDKTPENIFKCYNFWHKCGLLKTYAFDKFSNFLIAVYKDQNPLADVT